MSWFDQGIPCWVVCPWLILSFAQNIVRACSMFYPYEGYWSVTPLDAARVNRTLFHNHSVYWYFITLIKGRYTSEITIKSRSITTKFCFRYNSIKAVILVCTMHVVCNFGFIDVDSSLGECYKRFSLPFIFVAFFFRFRFPSVCVFDQPAPCIHSLRKLRTPGCTSFEYTPPPSTASLFGRINLEPSRHSIQAHR